MQGWGMWGGGGEAGAGAGRHVITSLISIYIAAVGQACHKHNKA